MTLNQSTNKIKTWSAPCMVVVALLLTACGSPYRPPVDELGGTQRFLDDGRTHRINAGETLYAVAWMYDLDFVALARHNNLSEPYVLTPGDSLRVDLRERTFNQSTPATTVARAPTTTSGVTVNPAGGGGGITRSTLPDSGLQRTPLPDNSPPPQPQALPPLPQSEPERETLAVVIPPSVPEPIRTPEPAVIPPPAPPPTPAPASPPSQALPAGPITWDWPSQGNIIGRYSEAGVDNKGLKFAGNRGDAVKAAADGQVVYAGSGLLRYGDLIIIKHDDRFLSAYAHNDRILVREGAMVKRGDTIAELGSSGIDRTMLHFEIRVEGNPVDPATYLPPR
jgi:lipoprotein NlpD